MTDVSTCGFPIEPQPRPEVTPLLCLVIAVKVSSSPVRFWVLLLNVSVEPPNHFMETSDICEPEKRPSDLFGLSRADLGMAEDLGYPSSPWALRCSVTQQVQGSLWKFRGLRARLLPRRQFLRQKLSYLARWEDHKAIQSKRRPKMSSGLRASLPCHATGWGKSAEITLEW